METGGIFPDLYLHTTSYCIIYRWSPNILRSSRGFFFSENVFILVRPLSSIAFTEGLNSFRLARIRRLEP
jgi:hypothetical protein